MRPIDLKKSLALWLLLAVSAAGSPGCSEDGPSLSPSAGGNPPGGSSGPSNPSAPSALTISAIEPNTNVGLSPGATLTIRGTGFHPSAIFSVDGTPVDTFEVSASEAKFLYVPSSFSDGPLGVTVENPDGQSSLLMDAFFHFSSPRWRSIPDFLDGTVRDIQASGAGFFLATDSGPQRLQAGGFKSGTSPDLTFCASDFEPVFLNCPNCLNEIPTCHETEQIAHLPLSNENYVLTQERFDVLRDVLQSGDGLSWGSLGIAPSIPLAISSTPSAVYLLDSNGLSALAPDGLNLFIALSEEMKGVVIADGVSASDFHLAVHEDGDDTYFFVGTPRGLYQASYRFSTKTASPWLFSGPAGARITDAVVHHLQGQVYFSFVPNDQILLSGNGAVGKLRVGFLDWTTFAPLPHVYDLAVVEDGLLAAGWNPSSPEKDSIIYRITATGVVSHVYSRLKTLGLPALPTSTEDPITAIEYEDGRWYAFLKARRCLLESVGVPSAVSEIECLGTETGLLRGTHFLFVADGAVHASTEDGTFRLDPSTQSWESSTLSDGGSLRQDLNVDTLPHQDGIEGGPVTCALEVPEKELSFACATQDVYVSYRQGRWTRLEWDAPIVSLAVTDGRFLYGASEAQGVFVLPLD